MTHWACLAKPDGKGSAELKTISGKTIADIERQANKWGTTRIAFRSGEIWRKLGEEWIVI